MTRIANNVEEFAALAALYREFLGRNPHIHHGTALSAVLRLLTAHMDTP